MSVGEERLELGWLPLVEDLEYFYRDLEFRKIEARFQLMDEFRGIMVGARPGFSVLIEIWGKGRGTPNRQVFRKDLEGPGVKPDLKSILRDLEEDALKSKEGPVGHRFPILLESEMINRKGLWIVRRYEALKESFEAFSLNGITSHWVIHSYAYYADPSETYLSIDLTGPLPFKVTRYILETACVVIRRVRRV